MCVVCLYVTLDHYDLPRLPAAVGFGSKSESSGNFFRTLGLTGFTTCAGDVPSRFG